MKNKFNTWLIVINLALIITLLFHIDIIKSFIYLIFAADIFVIAYQYNKKRKE